MENIRISKEQEQKLLSLFKERKKLSIAFLVLGLSGLVPTIITLFGGPATNPFTVTTFVFFIIGIAFWTQSKEAVKSVETGGYQAYKTACRKVGWESATVDNNEVLSKKIKKATKKVAILGSRKSIQAGEEIGILKAGKDFWAFSLKN